MRACFRGRPVDAWSAGLLLHSAVTDRAAPEGGRRGAPPPRGPGGGQGERSPESRGRRRVSGRLHPHPFRGRHPTPTRGDAERTPVTTQALSRSSQRPTPPRGQRRRPSTELTDRGRRGPPRGGVPPGRRRWAAAGVGAPGPGAPSEHRPFPSRPVPPRRGLRRGVRLPSAAGAGSRQQVGGRGSEQKAAALLSVSATVAPASGGPGARSPGAPRAGRAAEAARGRGEPARPLLSLVARGGRGGPGPRGPQPRAPPRGPGPGPARGPTFL